MSDHLNPPPPLPQNNIFYIPQQEVIFPFPDFTNKEYEERYNQACHELAKKFGPMWNTEFHTLVKNYSKSKGKETVFSCGNGIKIKSFSINDIDDYFKILKSNNLYMCNFREIGTFLLENIGNRICFISIIEIKNFKEFDFFNFFFDKNNCERIEKYLAELEHKKY